MSKQLMIKTILMHFNNKIKNKQISCLYSKESNNNLHAIDNVILI